MDGSGLINRWGRIREVATKPGSILASDNAHSGKAGFEKVVTHFLDVAADSLNSIIKVMDLGTASPTVPFSSHYGLLRMHLEASTKAYWLLQSEEQSERLIRLLSLLKGEKEQEKRLWLSALEQLAHDNQEYSGSRYKRTRQEISSYAKKFYQSLKTVSRLNSLEENRWNQSLTVTKILLEAGEAQKVGAHPQIMWSILSGLSHSSYTRFQSFSQRNNLQEDKSGVFVSSSTKWFRLGAIAALHSFEKSIEIVGVRKLEVRR